MRVDDGSNRVDDAGSALERILGAALSVEEDVRGIASSTGAMAGDADRLTGLMAVHRRGAARK